MNCIGVRGFPECVSFYTDTIACGFIYPLDNYTVVGQRPEVIRRNSLGLHADGGPCVQYRDGWKMWALNGVTVPEYLAMTPAEQIDPAKILKESNLEVRREGIRKVGIERMLAHLPHKTLGCSGSYTLLSVRLSEEIPDSRWLKMLNPSIGVWHMEAVAPECATVEQALNWRNQQQDNETVEILT